MNKRIASLLATGVLALVGCPVTPVPQPPPPQNVATCDTVCAHWRALGCQQADPTPAGEPCESVCSNLVSSGMIDWDLDCRASVASCDAIDACERE